MTLQSPRFAGDPVLESCLAGTHRMMAPEKGEPVVKVQQALIDLGYPIPAGATGNFLGQTGAAVVLFKQKHGLKPDDPVVGPGTIRALDEDIVKLDGGAQPPAPQIANLEGKVFYAGVGAKIPMIDFGLGAAEFKLWLRRDGGSFAGYTTATNDGLGGSAVLETPIIQFIANDSPLLTSLHGSEVRVVIRSSTFVQDGGNIDFELTVKNNAGDDAVLKFSSGGVKGYSAVVEQITFNATLL